MSTQTERRFDDYALALSRILVDSINNELWEPRKQWAAEKLPGASLSIVVGTGRKTYVKHKHKGAEFKMTIGVLNIRDKLSPQSAAGWLTMREIMGRGKSLGRLRCSPI